MKLMAFHGSRNLLALFYFEKKKKKKEDIKKNVLNVLNNYRNSLQIL